MVKLLLDVDSPVHLVGDRVVIKVSLASDLDRSAKATISVDLLMNNEHVGTREYTVMLIPGEVASIDIDFNLSKPGLWVVRVSAGVDSVKVSDSIKIRAVELNRPIKLALVYHMHQPPWYMSNGKYYADWAFRYVYSSIMAPFFTGGPYMFHAYLNDKYKDIKVNIHLSPSLLRQWDDAIENGYSLVNGETHTRDSDEVKAVKETLNAYRTQIKRGQIEVLTSLYAHTIAGYLISRYSMVDVIDEELATGIEMTKAILGAEPAGVWTPEMAWTMELADIYEKYGLKYTVLCGTNHFPGSQGDKGTIYEPYRLEDKLDVFFRDERISNILSFQNNIYSDRDAIKLAAYVARSIVETNGGLVTIALDGENFIAMSKTPAMVGYMLDKLYSYISRMQELKIVETVKLSNVDLPRRSLSYIPTTTWLGGFTKWDGERREHQEYWARVIDVYNYVKGVEEAMGTKLSNARYALWHALDSDFWWAEFWTGQLIDHWINEAIRFVDSSFKVSIRPISDSYVGFINKPMTLELEVVNGTDNVLRFKLVCMDSQVDVALQPGISTVKCVLTPKLAGVYRIPVFLISRSRVYLHTYIKLNIYDMS